PAGPSPPHRAETPGCRPPKNPFHVKPRKRNPPKPPLPPDGSAVPRSDAPPVDRIERAWLILLLTLAVAARVAAPDRMAVEHFDEGVYSATSNEDFWFADDPEFRFPDRHLYAPPLLP